MEPAHRAKLRRQFGGRLKHARVVCLDIPDRYGFMDPALVALLPNVTATVNCGTANPVSCNINIQWNENTVAINTQETTALASPSYTLYVEP